METETPNPYMAPWADRQHGQLTETQQRWLDWKASQDADPQCTRCGTHTNTRECPDWCLRIGESCDCRHPLCGECMRRRGNKNLGVS